MPKKHVKVPVLKAKFFKDTAQFSLRQMVLFMLFFAALGIYFLWHSSAATITVGTLQAETMALPAGSSVITESGASGIRMTTRSMAGGTVGLNAPATQIGVRAKTNACGSAPQLVVKVDGQLVQTIAVTATSWTDQALVSANLPAGNHAVSVEMASDAFTQTIGNSGKVKCVRQLDIDKVTFYGQVADNIISVNDSTVGTGNNQFEFTGAWTAGPEAGSYGGDEHYAGAVDASYQVRFNGTQAKVFTTFDTKHGIAAVSVDGGPETAVDTYAASRQYGVLAYTSPALADGPHTLKVRVTGTKNAAATAAYIVADRVELTTSTSTSPASPPIVLITNPVNGSTYSGPIAVSAGASSSSSTVAKVEFYLDGALQRADGDAPYCLLDNGPGTPCNTWDTKSVSDGSHTFTAYAYDMNGLKSAASSVTFTVKNTVTTSCANPAPFPSRLKTSGRKLVDENGCVMPTLKGFNIHAATANDPNWLWSNADFADIQSHGGRILRTVINWSAYEPTQGTINATNLATLDKHVARAQRNGLYIILELHLNVGAVPSWATSGNDETEKYAIYGQNITQTLAGRYSVARSADGLTINPKTVLGFSLNEPPQDSTTINGNNSIPTFEAQQRQMISWFRAAAPDWIGFVTLAYANQKPYLASPRISANPDAYDAVGGNVVFDAHDYLVYNSNEDPNTDSRQGNGVIADTRFFNPGAHWLALADPHSYTASTVHQEQMKNYLKPFDAYATNAQMPLMIGEFGWENKSGFYGKVEYYKAKRVAMDSVNSAIQIQWLYGTDPSRDSWSAKSGTTWDPDILGWLQAPSP